MPAEDPLAEVIEGAFLERYLSTEDPDVIAAAVRAFIANALNAEDERYSLEQAGRPDVLTLHVIDNLRATLLGEDPRG